MSRVTSSLQVTLPEAIAARHGIRPGDEIEWESAGDAIRVTKLTRTRTPGLDVRERLRRFDQATCRQEARNAAHRREGRGWSREDLYGRPRPR